MVHQLLISPLSSFARDFTLSITTITIIVITIITITITITIVIMMVAKLQIAPGQSFAALGCFLKQRPIWQVVQINLLQ